MNEIPAAAQGGSNEKADVARRIMELSGTIFDAIAYMRERLESMSEDAAGYAGMLQDIVEGLVSLDGAVTSVSKAIFPDPEDAERLAMDYDELLAGIEAMADAYINGRVTDLPAYSKTLCESYAAYHENLLRGFRSLAVM